LNGDVYSPFLKAVESDLIDQLKKGRITQVDVGVVSPTSLETNLTVTELHGKIENDRAKSLNSIMLKKSENAALILLVMPNRPTREDCLENSNAAKIYLSHIETLTANLPATYLVIAGERRSVMTTAI
jgi:hypothetical protein